jgi:hypothetical protein
MPFFPRGKAFLGRLPPFFQREKRSGLFVFRGKTDLFPMNFEQILQSKIKEQSPAGVFHQSGESLDTQGVDPAHLAYLLGQVTRQGALPRGKYAVHPRPRTPHALTESQRQSYAFLKNWISDLSEAFTRAELKAAFRQAALLLHPDCGGTAESFMELRGHYHRLDSIFT